MQLNSRVAVVQLPKSNSKPNGSIEAAGWGDMNSPSSLWELPNSPAILQTVDLKVIDDHKCEKVFDQKLHEIYGPELDEVSLHETSFCTTGPMTGGKGMCSVSYSLS